MRQRSRAIHSYEFFNVLTDARQILEYQEKRAPEGARVMA